MAILAVALGAVVILLNLGAAALACSTENSYCAGSPRLWRGRVYGVNRAPVRAATVLYTFASEQPRGIPLGREVEVATDAAGRYCLRWPSEKVTAALRVVGVVAGDTPDPRLQTLAIDTRGPIIVTPDAASGLVAAPGTPGGRQVYVPVISHPWNPATDATSRCIERNPPWYRREGLIVNWRSLLVFALGAVAVGLGVLSLVPSGARLALSTGAAGTGALAAILFVLIWITKSV